MSKIKIFIIVAVIINLLNFVAVGVLVYRNTRFDTLPNKVSFSFSKKESEPENFLPEPVTFEKVFLDDHAWTATLPAERIRTVIATGDVIPARSVNNNVVVLNNFKWPFELTADFLRSGDITLINLENPLIPNCPTTVEGMIFCGDVRNVEGLVYAGVDVASVANNHTGNHGLDGLEYTKKLLKDNGIVPHGLDAVAYKDVRGLKFAFLAYTEVPGSDPLPNHVDDVKMVESVKEAQEKADIIVVSYHWGDEYTAQPNLRQREIAHKTIDAGADLVIGNHPHWIQPFERYRDKFIMYAHGNFVFDQMWSRKTELGVVGKYTFLDTTLIDVEYLPVEIADLGQPYFLTGEAKNQVLEELKTESKILNK